MDDATPGNETPEAAPAVRKSLWPAIIAVAEPLSVAGLLVFLLGKSWLKWSDPLIDFPRDLYIAWRISAGDLLYRELANWYGPLANLVEGAGFKVFGVGFDTMVWMNMVLLVAALLLLRAIFGLIGNRLSVWLGSVVFLVVFAFGNLAYISNYNFITPYVAQSTYSFLGLLLVLWGLLKHLKTDRLIWLGVAGVGLAVAYLDKPEAVLAAMGAIGIYVFLHSGWLRRRGDAAERWEVNAIGWLAGGFLCLWLPVFGYFFARGGWSFALEATDRVLTTLLDPAIRGTGLREQLMQHNMGTDQPWQNFLIELRLGGGMALACGAIILGAWALGRQRKFSSRWWLGLVGMIGAVALGGGMGMAADGWRGTGPAFLLPVFVTTAVTAGRSLRSAQSDKKEFNRLLGLAVVGVAASLMLARMILFPRLDQYGFFMMPLAVCFWIQIIAVEGAGYVRKIGCNQAAGWVGGAFTVLVLFAAAAVMKFELHFYSIKTYSLGNGRDHFYTFQPEQDEHGALIFSSGMILDTMLRAYRLQTPHARTLATFPEGIAANYHLRVPSPLAEEEFNPAALSFAGVEHILDELKTRPPEVVMLFARDYTEYGSKHFGADTASGRDILLWLNEHYDIAVQAGVTPTSETGHVVDLAVPAREGDNFLPILSAGK